MRERGSQDDGEVFKAACRDVSAPQRPGGPAPASISCWVLWAEPGAAGERNPEGGLEPRTFGTAATTSPWFIQPHTHTHLLLNLCVGGRLQESLCKSRCISLSLILLIYLRSLSPPPPRPPSLPLLYLIERIAGLSAASLLFLVLTQIF